MKWTGVMAGCGSCCNSSRVHVRGLLLVLLILLLEVGWQQLASYAL